MKKTALRSSGRAALSVLALVAAAGAALAADDQSWLCKYIPSACGNEEDPGGLPGHSGGAAGSAAPASEATRGLSNDDAGAPADAAPVVTAPAPEPAPEAPPAEEPGN